MNDYTLSQETDFFESREFSVDGLKIPDSDTAKQLTAEVSNVPGSVGLVSPMNYDLRLAIAKGLCGKDGFGKKYLYMQALYRKIFERWLLESTSLQEFDSRLKNSELDFVPVPAKRQSFYQMYSTWGLQFIYLCSNIPIERLEEGDLELLQSSIKNGNAEVMPELTDMVKRTFSDVLIANPDLDDNVFCGYGYGGDISPNRSVVLEIYNYDFNETGDFRDFENNAKRDEYMIKLAEEIEQTLSEQIKHRVVVKVEY